jgi:3-dehydroquinate dehydratase/shikimate dehydrogenase
MHPKVDQSPLPRIPASVRVVFDTIYNPPQTRLLAMAKAAGRLTVSGLEMFVSQAAGQFEIWTGKPAPRETMRRVVAERLARTN